MTNTKTRKFTAILWIVSALSLMGIGIAAVALYEHVVYANGLSTEPSFCSISAYIDCRKVNSSEWSTFFGLPIGAYGIFFYATLLGLSLVSLGSRAVAHEDSLGVVLVAAVLASLVSMALFAISHFIIGALCIMCMALYLINFILLGVTAFGVWRGRIGDGLRTGFDAIGAFLGMTIILMPGRSQYGALIARIGFVLILLLGYLCALLPGEMLSSLQGPDRALASPRVKDMVASWKAAAPESPIVVDGDGPQADLRLGTPNAPISIVEFADFECPGCRRMYVMLHSLLKEYDGKYSFVFKNYPLDQDCNPTITRRFHIHACNAAYFTRCAGEQGKLREAVDYVFTTPILDDAEALTSMEVQDAIVEKGSAQLGLDEAAVRECVASKRYKAKLQGDVEEGRRLNLTGTPAIWVNGKLVKSSNPEVFKAIFNSILAEKK